MECAKIVQQEIDDFTLNTYNQSIAVIVMSLLDNDKNKHACSCYCNWYIGTMRVANEINYICGHFFADYVHKRRCVGVRLSVRDYIINHTLKPHRVNGVYTNERESCTEKWNAWERERQAKRLGETRGKREKDDANERKKESLRRVGAAARRSEIATPNKVKEKWT